MGKVVKVPPKRQRAALPESVAMHMRPCSRNRPRPRASSSQEDIHPSVSEEAEPRTPRHVKPSIPHDLVPGPPEAHADVCHELRDGDSLDLAGGGGLDPEDNGALDLDEDGGLVHPYDDPLDAPSDSEEAAMALNTDQPAHDQGAPPSAHAIKEQRRLAALAAFLYSCVRALYAFMNPVRTNCLCDVDGCHAQAEAICTTCHATHSAAHLCALHADIHDQQTLCHKIVRDVTKPRVNDLRCCDGDIVAKHVVRLHTFDIDADKIFVTTCDDHKIGPFLIGIGFMPDNIDDPRHAFSINIVNAAAMMRACGAPYQTSFEGLYGFSKKSTLYKPFVDATRHMIAFQQHVHHQDLVGDVDDPNTATDRKDSLRCM